ncbi:MAG: PD-(D/E)XK nuclease family protein, partial [Betaproteobacteria bacterium]|nr:PD-(D/E)XK nuclease family protein [Betaproteobacteria bacterium]
MRADLARRIENGCMVLTPNRRLAAHLEREFNLAQIAARRAVWPSAEIVSYSTWLERAYAGLGRLDAGESLLSEAQELALWERVVCASPQAEALLSPAAVARAAREAWRIQHAFRIDLVRCAPSLDEDATA